MSSSYRRLSLLAAGSAVVAIATAAAAPAWADPAPSYETLLERIGQTPVNVEAGALFDAAEARVRQARTRPNPIVGLTADGVLGSGPYDGYGNAETSLALTQDLELWGVGAPGWTSREAKPEHRLFVAISPASTRQADWRWSTQKPRPQIVAFNWPRRP